MVQSQRKQLVDKKLKYIYKKLASRVPYMRKITGETNFWVHLNY